MARLTAADGAGPSSQTPSPAPSSGPVSSRHSSSAHGGGGSGSAAARRRTSHPPPSPSSTSQSGADDDDDDDAADFADDFSSAPFRLSSRRNTIKARSAADVLAVSPQTSGSSMMDAEGSSAAAYYEPSPSPSELPHEILLHIFKYVAHRPADLFRCLLVCKAWCLCGVELLWHRPAFPNMDTLELFTHVLEAPDTTFEYASFVRRLSFAGIVNDVRDEHFLPFRVCHRLERLALAGCKALSNDAIVEALQHLRGIVAADLTDLVQLEDSAIEMLYKTCARLQGLNLSGCAKVTSGAVAALAKTCTLLRRVKLCGCVGIGDEAFAALTMHCPVLLEVDVAGCALISDISVRELWRRAFHIRELRLAHCGALTDLAFPAPNSVFQNTLRTGPSALHQTGWGGIESAPASRGTSPVGGMAAGHLTLRHASSGDGLFPRTATLPMPSPTMTHLAPPRTFDHLRILDITNCSTISDAAIEGIVTHVPRIKNLILAKCTRLTDDAVYSIAKLGKNLHYLHLGHVSK
jgi:F-box and leucine-rich repeat protein GRR1